MTLSEIDAIVTSIVDKLASEYARSTEPMSMFYRRSHGAIAGDVVMVGYNTEPPTAYELATPRVFHGGLPFTAFRCFARGIVRRLPILASD